MSTYREDRGARVNKIHKAFNVDSLTLPKGCEGCPLVDLLRKNFLKQTSQRE